MKILLAVIAVAALTSCAPHNTERVDVVKWLKSCTAQGNNIYECQVEICIVYTYRQNCNPPQW